ncbi:hypothetical protein DPEC_G00289630 [Dallia pectoralis]|uniref:Uncharacterized protein n=1 Tax=Dallia pectoralis TaxID=75939 RepID=A0ACC2FKY0_DALPE|nr:hypothetical protein DPEC_G00289630 [Dallia pectoralis]
MIIEVDTRWNSTYSMLERLYQLREPVGAALASLNTDITPLTALEYETVQDALDVLAPFRQATVELSGEKRVSSSKVIPLMKMLNHAVMSKLEGLKSNLTKQLGDSLGRQVRENAVHLESLSVMTIPTLLDPRFKKTRVLETRETARSGIEIKIGMRYCDPKFWSPFCFHQHTPSSAGSLFRSRSIFKQ